MPRRALIDTRPWLLAGIVMAMAFWLLTDNTLRGLFLVAVKGGSVAALAGYALTQSRAQDARVIAAVMMVGAAGDVAIEFDTALGGGFFLLSHLIAIALYLRNRRLDSSATQKLASIALVVGVPCGAWLLTRDPLAVIYAVGLGAMAATAWVSRFSRYNVGVGALLFIASDLLIFARLGGVLPQSLTSWFVWPLYYAGQLLICTGVVRTLTRDRET